MAASVGAAAWQVTELALCAVDSEISYLSDEDILLREELPLKTLTEEQSLAAAYLFEALYIDEEYLSSGTWIDENTVYNEIYALFDQEYLYSDYDYTENADNEAVVTVYPADEDDEDALTDEQITAIVSAVSASFNPDDSSLSAFRSWLSYNRGVYAVIRQQIIDDQLLDTDTTRQWLLEHLDGYDYYAYSSATETTLTNLDVEDAAAAKKALATPAYPLICAMEQDQTLSWDMTAALSGSYSYDNWLNYPFDDSDGIGENDVLILALRQSTLTEAQTQWREDNVLARKTAAVCAGAAAVFLLCLIVLICGAGWKTGESGDGYPHLIWFDRLWTEIQVILVAGIFYAAWIVVRLCLYQRDMLADETLQLTFGILSAGVTALVLPLLLSQVRRIKTGTLLDGWTVIRCIRRICTALFTGISRAIRWLFAQFRATSLRRRIIIVGLLAPLACAFWPFIPFVIAGAVYWGLREAERFETVTNGARDIRAGSVQTQIRLTGGGQELRQLADDLNGIADGLNDAVQTAVQSERLKSELISNVSHDIKTPLTSIITYIDLLKKCDLDDPTAREYLDILDQKAQRLRILTSDLFDASKATSGAMKVERVKTDFDALLRQALGERSEHLERAGLDVRIDSAPPVYVNADGRLLWRILDNLISNCARYALPNSRVYITITTDDDCAALTMKNISAQELNIPAEELMQRFTRGDRSRHTEGSGLGLSIAKSLAELMDGACRVEIDGDLFKAIVTIPLWK